MLKIKTIGQTAVGTEKNLALITRTIEIKWLSLVAKSYAYVHYS